MGFFQLGQSPHHKTPRISTGAVIQWHVPAFHFFSSKFCMCYGYAKNALNCSCGRTKHLPLALPLLSSSVSFLPPPLVFFLPSDSSLTTSISRSWRSQIVALCPAGCPQSLFYPLSSHSALRVHHGADRQTRAPFCGREASQGGSRTHSLLEEMGSLCGRATMGNW